MDCSRAFCASHQARPRGGGSYSDLCSDCLVKRARREQGWIEAAEAQAAAELARAEDELSARNRRQHTAVHTSRERLAAVAERLARAGSRTSKDGSRNSIWFVGLFDWLVDYPERFGTFESDARTARERRYTYVLGDGQIVSPSQDHLGGTPRKLADDDVLLDVVSAFTLLAEGLLRR